MFDVLEAGRSGEIFAEETQELFHVTVISLNGFFRDAALQRQMVDPGLLLGGKVGFGDNQDFRVRRRHKSLLG